MNKSERNVLLVVIILFLLGLFFWHISSGPKTPQEIPLAPVTPSTGTLATPVQPTPVAPTPVKPPVAPIEKPKPPHTKPVVPATTPNGTPIAPKIELHKELIPKNIDIVRCYYAHDVTPPGTTTGFDINGSGFTSEFQQMIKVESGNDDIQIKNLQLVTANQIHGDLVIGPKSKTGFVFPRVLIH